MFDFFFNNAFFDTILRYVENIRDALLDIILSLYDPILGTFAAFHRLMDDTITLMPFLPERIAFFIGCGIAIAVVLKIFGRSN